MSSYRRLKRISLQAGVDSLHGQLLPGLFEVLLDQDALEAMMRRAYWNKGRECKDGPLIVIYRAATQAQAEYMVAHPPDEMLQSAHENKPLSIVTSQEKRQHKKP